MTSSKRAVRAFAAGVLLVGATLLAGCVPLGQNVMNPYENAKTPELAALASYGTFVVFEEQAAAIVRAPGTPQSVREALATADAVAKPTADALLVAALDVVKVRSALSAGLTTDQRLEIVNQNLLRWYQTFQPQLARLVDTVKENSR